MWTPVGPRKHVLDDVGRFEPSTREFMIFVESYNSFIKNRLFVER